MVGRQQWLIDCGSGSVFTGIGYVYTQVGNKKMGGSERTEPPASFPSLQREEKSNCSAEPPPSSPRERSSSGYICVTVLCMEWMSPWARGLGALKNDEMSCC